MTRRTILRLIALALSLALILTVSLLMMGPSERPGQALALEPGAFAVDGRVFSADELSAQVQAAIPPERYRTAGVEGEILRAIASRLTYEQLLRAEARERGIRIPPAHLEENMRLLGGEGSGLAPERLREMAEIASIERRIKDSLNAEDPPRITEQRIRAFYRDSADLLRRPASRPAFVIANRRPEPVREAIAALREGFTPAQVRARFGEPVGPEADGAGQVIVQEGVLGAANLARVFRAPLGEPVGPLREGGIWLALISNNATEPAVMPSLEEVRRFIRASLVAQDEQERWARFSRTLRAERAGLIVDPHGIIPPLAPRAPSNDTAPPTVRDLPEPPKPGPAPGVIR